MQKAIYVKKLKTKKDIAISISFFQNILTHVIFLLNKMIDEIKKYLPSKVKPITAIV